MTGHLSRQYRCTHWYQCGSSACAVHNARPILPLLTAPFRPAAAPQGSNHVKRVLKERQRTRKLDAHLAEQFQSGRLFACISSRPGQCGRADGYILEGRELEFYLKKMQKKKTKA